MKKDNFKRQISIKTISLGVITLKSFSSLFSRKVSGDSSQIGQVRLKSQWLMANG